MKKTKCKICGAEIDTEDWHSAASTIKMAEMRAAIGQKIFTELVKSKIKKRRTKK